MKRYTIKLSVIDGSGNKSNKLCVVYAHTLSMALEKVKKYTGECGWQFRELARYSEELSK